MEEKNNNAHCPGSPRNGSGYESFQVQPDTPSDYSRQIEFQDPQKHDQIHVDVNQVYNESDSSESVSDIDEEYLEKSLPSSQLRRVKSIARPGTLRLRNANALNLSDNFESRRFDVHEEANLVTQFEGLDSLATTRFKESTLPLHAKKSVRRTVKASRAKSIGRWKETKLSMSSRWDHFKSKVVDFFKNIDIWKSNLKPVEGKFGSGVLSYFEFLRWLFLLDVVISILVLGFVVTPQLLYSPSSKNNTVSFSGKEFLSGEGWFANTEMYYGVYHNATISLVSGTYYNLPLAYLCVAGGYILLCLIILVRSMGISYRRIYIAGQDTRNSFFTKVFCSWDYALTQKNSAVLESKNIYNDFIESLSENQKRKERGSKELCQLIFLRLVTNLLSFAMIACACYLIFYVSNEATKNLQTDELTKSMLPAISMSALNLFLPFAFRIIASLEQYQLPKETIAVSLFRTILLKLATICVYVVVLYTEVKCLTDAADKNCDKVTCWETWVGQQIYKLVVIDFLFLLFSTIFGEYIRRIIAEYVPFCDGKLDRPGFDISRNVLDLIYAQGLCWVGAFFSPMLPLITVIKLFILFYFKKDSVMRNCRPSMRPFKASKMKLLLLFLLSLMLVMACIVIGYIIINEGSLKPSDTCGPFRGKGSIYQLVKDVIDNDLSTPLRNTVNVIASATVLAVLFFVLGLMAYYFRLRKSSAEKKIKLLKEQISLAGQDKLYLLREIRKILKTQGRATDQAQT
ncbi:transmembrane channel-like protein 7 isoform X2 [Rhopilema esculentum]|uniref:transmembrane channel-like protein 7 isoform X2 n=1 Tax=Rhopilema esculentum TaxID=499914 RepID=UPI0031D9CF5C